MKSNAHLNNMRFYKTMTQMSLDERKILSYISKGIPGHAGRLSSPAADNPQQLFQNLQY